jgi:hypothetical protein
MGELFPAGVIALRHRLLKGARDLQAGQEPSELHATARIACTNRQSEAP